MMDIDVREGDLVIFSLWGRLFGQETRTEYAYLQTAPEDVSLLAGYCGFFEDQKLPAICGMSTTDLQYYNIRADVWEPLMGGYGSVGWRDYALNTGGSVSAVGGTHPGNCCTVMRRRVGPAGRANRGRVYLPGVPRAWSPAGQFGGIDWINACNNFNVEMSRDLHDAADPTPLPLATPELVKRGPTGLVLSTQKVNFWDPNQIVRSQRRREIGVGI